MFESHVVTSVDKTSFDFRRNIFEQYSFVSIPLLRFYCVNDQQSITRSRRSVLNFKLSVLTFSRLMSCQFSLFQGWWTARWALSKNCAKWNISTPIYVECDKMYSSKVCVQEFSYFVSDLDIQIEKNGYNSLVQVIDLGRHWGQDLVLTTRAACIRLHGKF